MELPPGVLAQLTDALGEVTSSAVVAETSDGAPIWRVATVSGHVAVKAHHGSGRTAREIAVLGALGWLAASGWADGEPWLATTWHTGKTSYERWAALREGTSAHPIARRGALLAAIDLCMAVSRLHASGWVHGDLQPGHGIHTARGLRLLGLADARGPAGAVPDALDAYNYRGGELSLTAPEVCATVASGRTPVPTAAADMYALAATLWLCWTGQPPVDYEAVGASADDPPELRRKLIAAGLPRPQIPDRIAWPRLETRLAAALGPDPYRRPTAAQFARSLEVILSTAIT